MTKREGSGSREKRSARRTFLRTPRAKPSLQLDFRLCLAGLPRQCQMEDSILVFIRSEEIHVVEGESQPDQRTDIGVLTQTRHLAGDVGGEPRLERPNRRTAQGVRGGLKVREVHLNDGSVGLDQGVRYGLAPPGQPRGVDGLRTELLALATARWRGAAREVITSAIERRVIFGTPLAEYLPER